MMRAIDEKAVSEVIGVVLLISVTVLGVAIVAVTFLSQPAPSEIPHVSVVAGATNTTFVLSHEGGDALAKGSYRIYVDNGSGLEDRTDEFILTGGNVWSIGKNLTYTGTGTPQRVVISVVDSGGGEMVIAEPAYAGVVDTGGYVDAGGSGVVPVTPGGGSEISPIFIVLPELGTDMNFSSGGSGSGPSGHYYSDVSANVTDPNITRVDFVMYEYEVPTNVYDFQPDAQWNPVDHKYHSEFEIQHGHIKDVEIAVVMAIAFNNTAVVGCEARKVNITVIK
jgi:FlaG/FlaF family flagellin (archaellin)